VEASVHLNEEIGSVVEVNVKGAFCMARRFGDRINGESRCSVTFCDVGG
jgi:hypothetical protein